MIFNFHQGYKVCVMAFHLYLVILTGDVVISYAAVLLMPGQPDESRIHS